MGTVREAFEASTDFTVGIEEEFAILDPDTLSLAHRFAELNEAAGRGRRAGGRGGRGADPVGDRDPLGPRRGPRRRRGPAARGPRAAVPPGRRPRSAPGRHRHPSRGAPGRSSGSSTPTTTTAWSRTSSTWPGATTPSAPHVHVGVRGADRAIAVCDRLRAAPSGVAGALVQLAVPRRPRLRPALGAQPDLHQELPPLRDPRALRELPRLLRLRGLPGAHALDRGAHPALVERPPAPRLRHRGGAHLRRPDHGRGLDRAGGADRGLRGTGGPRHRRGRALRAAPRPGRRGELLAGDPLRARRPADRPGPRGGVPGGGHRRPAAGLDGARTRVARDRPSPCRRRAGRSASAARSQAGASIEQVYAAEVAETQRTYAAQGVAR